MRPFQPERHERKSRFSPQQRARNWGFLYFPSKGFEPVLDPQRTFVDGRDGLQPAIPLVRGAERVGDHVWDATVLTKNRDRLLEADAAKELLSWVVEQAQTKGLTSDEHFTVDGTLLED